MVPLIGWLGGSSILVDRRVVVLASVVARLVVDLLIDCVCVWLCVCLVCVCE